MRRRKLGITLAAAALFGVLLAVPASAELRRVSVTLVTGQTITTTVDVPPGASVQSIQIPGLPAPVQSITDLGPVATPSPAGADRRPGRPRGSGDPRHARRARTQGGTRRRQPSGGGNGGKGSGDAGRAADR